MKVIRKIAEMQSMSKSLQKSGKTIGFVPTMGFLHEGHLSLIREARRKADTVVVSIFINPTQFAPGEDLDKYPRDFQRDENLCHDEGVDIIFYPDAREMYSSSFKTFVVTNELSTKLCGISRPTHFRGVATIVAKLFNIVKPDFAVFGQKDAQQSLIIRKMVADLNFETEIIVAPIIREKDGLAMSSRNKFLSPAQRKDALIIFNSLKMAEKMISGGEQVANIIKQAIHDNFHKVASAKIDYISIVDFEKLNAVETITGNTLIAIAAYFGETRLIDNIIIK